MLLLLRISRADVHREVLLKAAAHGWKGRDCEGRGAKGTIRATKPGGKGWMAFYTTFLGVLLLNLMPRKRIKLDVVQ